MIPPRKPIIGLSANIDAETSRLHRAYVHAVIQAGGIPVIIPASADENALNGALDAVDGLILTGGADIAGHYFGEPTLPELTEVVPGRDEYDFLLLRLAARQQMPVFGICRGMQVINVAYGGTMWQDIPSQFPGNPLNHSVLTPREKPVHPVQLAAGSRLSEIFGFGDSEGELYVNSRHHQAIKSIAPGFRATAVAPDGVIEGIEASVCYGPHRGVFGVQWHPENMAAEGHDPAMQQLFAAVVNEAKLFARAKAVHDTYIIADSHVDTPMLFEQHAMDIGQEGAMAKVDLPKMEQGRVDAACMVAYLPQGERNTEAYTAVWDKTLGLLDQIQRQIAANEDRVGQARNFDEVERLKRDGKKAILLGVENGYAIGCDLDKLQTLSGLGVVYMTLCHNGPNDLCDSCKGPAEHGGLSPLGREAVRELERLGIAVDISHAAESTFYDVLSVASRPVIASHSSVRALCDHPRNLTDDQIRALAAGGGVIQICLYGPFLAAGRAATLLDAVEHIDHVVQLVGVDHVGIGSDFDGDGGIAGCDGSNELIHITIELLRRGYTPEELGKIWGGNLWRALAA